METEKKIIGRCPLCGGNVVKTCKGYRCEHNIGDSPSCVLNINAIIGNVLGQQPRRRHQKAPVLKS